jgi:hypothetical protein
MAGRLRRLIAAAPADGPLPTTRELGERFGVANTTVFRLLRDLAARGEIWQHPVNGRYFPASARARLDRPKPLACLLRRLELGSELYREFLEGVSAGCGAAHRTMLLWHDELLVNHPDPAEPPLFASIARQDAILADFIARHADTAGGFILDHLWGGRALAAHAAALRPAVVLFRGTAIPGFGNVRADLRAGAFKALGHLLGRGFEQIVPLRPFAGDPAVDEFESALAVAAQELDCRARLAPTAAATTDAERAALAQRLRRSPRRTALLCPEDNVARLVLGVLRDAGIALPRDVGLLSVMGTAVAAQAGLSCLRYDFRAMGRTAVELLGAPEPTVGSRVFEPTFVSGDTT